MDAGGLAPAGPAPDGGASGGPTPMAWQPSPLAGPSSAAAAFPLSPPRAPPAHHAVAAASAGPAWFSPPRHRVAYSDRFIPSRAGTSARLDFSPLDRELAAAEVNAAAGQREDLNPAYNMLLRSELLGCACPAAISPDKAAQLAQLRAPCSPGKKLLRFKCGDAASPAAGPPPASPFAASPVGGGGGGARDGGYSAYSASAPPTPRRPPRKIPRAPFKVLDAPALQDDFYLNLVDWSAQNVLAVGLGSCVYLWSAHTSKVTKLCDLAPAADTVCSVSWSQRGTYLSVGTNAGDVQLWDAAKLKRVRTMSGHRARVGAQAWAGHVLSSGSRDRSVLQRDVRAREPFVTKLLAHRSEVCGLKWSPDDRQLASGGNDNCLHVWAAAGASPAPLLSFREHTAAVKAIAWSPHQHGLLASGGGTADRCLRFWSTSTGAALSAVDTGSQVCNLAWSRNANELVSAHGYSQNQVVVWKYPSMTKLATLTGHSYRVLYLAVAPDGQTVVTGAGDETLRFWNLFPGPRGGGAGGGGGGGGNGGVVVGGGSGGGSGESSVTAMMRTHIR